MRQTPEAADGPELHSGVSRLVNRAVTALRGYAERAVTKRIVLIEDDTDFTRC